MLEQIIKNPKNVKALAEEIKKVTDQYWSRQVPEAHAKTYILYWADKEGKKLFSGNVLNPTIRKIIGVKRLELVNKWLEGTQFSMFL